MTLTTGDWAHSYSQSAICLRLNGILAAPARKPAQLSPKDKVPDWLIANPG